MVAGFVCFAIGGLLGAGFAYEVLLLGLVWFDT